MKMRNGMEKLHQNMACDENERVHRVDTEKRFHISDFFFLADFHFPQKLTCFCLTGDVKLHLHLLFGREI